MPPNIFANTGTNVSVIFLDKSENKKILLMDASNLGTKQKIEIDDFSVLVGLDEIAQKNFSFSAGQYFKVKIDYVDISEEEFQNKIQNFQADLQKFFAEGHELEQNILTQLQNLHLQ